MNRTTIKLINQRITTLAANRDVLQSRIAQSRVVIKDAQDRIHTNTMELSKVIEQITELQDDLNKEEKKCQD